ncbi:MAG TPA: NHL repeat-containing protein [Candidatus Krumholzibacteria bacterium]|nr:NHL repeat-containing protein [Candidatus Krumholzibacteria bacterium]
MRSRPHAFTLWVAGAVLALACAPARDAATAQEKPASSTAVPTDTLAPAFSFHTCDRVTIGDPQAVTIDFHGIAVLADASPPRLVSYNPATGGCQEFQAPAGRPAFRPSGVAVRGFFVYAVDETNRLLLRWDSSGAYRDVILNFEELNERRRVSPHGLDVDASGRTAVTDIENNQVIVFDTYLNVDVAFGNFGSFEGQMDTPQGVSFTPRGELLVADTGNARLQFFSDTGAFLRAIPPAGTASPLRRPRRGIATEDGRVFVADPVAGRVFEFSPAGALVRAIVPDRPGRFRPTDLAMAKDGMLLITDSASQSLFAVKVM